MISSVVSAAVARPRIRSTSCRPRPSHDLRIVTASSSIPNSTAVPGHRPSRSRIAIGTFATSRIVFIKELALGMGAAVALDASIVRAFLVPSLMALLGRWNWWAPGPLRRLHERLGLGEPAA